MFLQFIQGRRRVDSTKKEREEKKVSEYNKCGKELAKLQEVVTTTPDGLNGNGVPAVSSPYPFSSLVPRRVYIPRRTEF